MSRAGLAGLGYYALAIALGAGVVGSSFEQSRAFDRAAELSTLANKVASAASKAGSRIVRWGMFWTWRNPPAIAEDEYDAAMKSADRHGRQATRRGVLLGLATAGFVAFLRFGVLKAVPDGNRLAVRHLCFTSLVLFAVGIAATALSLIAFREVPVLGQIVFKFESKCIAQTILALFSSGNVVLAGLIFLFSIAVPLAKVGLTLFATWSHGPRHDTALRVIKAIGKWSMADVFVIAVLLAFFAMGGDGFTDAWVGPGVSFFAAYCILSMWAGVWLASGPA